MSFCKVEMVEIVQSSANNLIIINCPLILIVPYIITQKHIITQNKSLCYSFTQHMHSHNTCMQFTIVARRPLIQFTSYSIHCQFHVCVMCMHVVECAWWSNVDTKKAR